MTVLELQDQASVVLGELGLIHLEDVVEFGCLQLEPVAPEHSVMTIRYHGLITHEGEDEGFGQCRILEDRHVVRVKSSIGRRPVRYITYLIVGSSRCCDDQ